MAQHDYVISNASGSAVRSDLNNALSAIATQNSGSSEPTTTYAYMKWADTTAGVMKMRNGANNAWITLHQLDGEYSTIPLENGTAGAPSLYFKDSGIDTGVYSPGTDQVGIATAGVQRVNFNGATEVVFNDGGADVDFRVEGDTNPDLFKIDAGLDQVQVANLNGGPLAGFRNRIINGDFQIWQRGVTFTNANGYTSDRWIAGGTGTLCNVGQGSHPSGLGERVALNFTGVAGNTRSYALQRIESQNMASLYPAPYASTQVTLSVNIYSTSARTIDLIADYANTANDFSAITNITSHSVSVGANTFNRYSHTFTLPPEGARGIQIVLNAQTGITSGTVAFSLVQLEPGSVATPFEQRPIGTELSLCQRYFQWAPYNINFLATAPAQSLETSVMWAVPMRASPTAAALTPDPNTAQAAANNGSNVFQRLTPYGGSASAQSISATNIYVVGYRSGLSAEL